MLKMTRKRLSLALAIAEHNPLRPVYWRWDLALQWADQPKLPKDCPDPLIGQAAQFVQVLNREDNLDDPNFLVSPMRCAYLRYYEDGWNRAKLEASLLSGMSLDQVATRHGLTDRTLRLYAGIFFDVLPRLQARDYVLTHAISPARAFEREEEFAERRLKQVAYLMGPTRMDVLLKHVFDQDGQLRTDTPDLSTSEGRLAARARLMIHASRPGVSSAFVLECDRTSQRLQEIEQMTQRQMAESEPLLADVAAATANLGPAAALEEEQQRQALWKVRKTA